jgi:PucR C-terminal helix-turn-helix domain
MEPAPWESLPPDTATALRPELPGLADEIIEAISREVPDYARPLEGPFGRGLREGVEEALRQFMDMIEGPSTGRGPGREVYVNLGRGEWRAGRSLDALLAAYRVGARVAWRRLVAAGERAGLEPRTLYVLAESIFAYIDELSGESVEGFTREQAAAAGELQRRRARLVALLIQDPPADRAAVEAAAAEAGWPLPRTLAALAAEGEDADRLARRLDTDVLAAPAPPFVCVLVPDPDGPGRRDRLERATGERRAAIGPALTWPEAAISHARAQAALRLVLEGSLPADGGLIDATDHGVELLLGQDRRLSGELSAAALAPLEELTAAQRERLQDTLAAWLRHRGRTEQVAGALHVHPQTVRYRLGRLRELFGDVLDDPDARFELELALRAQTGYRPRAEE